MSRFEFAPTSLAGVYRATRKAIEDHRGSLSRLFCDDEFREVGVAKKIVQINHTVTRKKGAVRGLHFQRPPYAEVKIVNCLRGEIFDVAVDLRQGSPTFLKWHGEVLSSQNRASLVIPEGFAHGFQTLSADCELIYFHTAAYEAKSEGAFHVQDPQLKIQWPLPIEDLSDRDRGHAFLTGDFRGIEI